MIDLYAVQFEIEEASKESAEMRLTSTSSSVQHWIENAYKRQFGTLLHLPDEDFSLEPGSGRQVVKSSDIAANRGCGIARFSFTYPDKADGNLLWTARAHIAYFGDLVEFSMRLGLDSSQFVLSPVDVKVGRPQLIPHLLQSGRWTLGGTRVTDMPIILETIEVERFVTERLISAARRLPIILVSRVSSDETPLVDSRDLANHLSGISEVYEFRDKWASIKFTSLVGRDYACYNGALRIFWPRGRKTLESFNPYILPKDIVGSVANDVRKRLFGELSQISALRFLEGPITADATEFLERERLLRLDQEKEAARAAGDTALLISIAEEEVRDLRSINERYKQENDQLRKEHTAALVDLRTTQENLKAAWSPAAVNTEPANVPSGTAPIGSVFEAVSEATELYGATLVFHPKAISSAKDSPYKNPDDVRFALLALHDVCEQLRESRQSKKAIGRLEDQFMKRGYIYRAHESETSMSGKMGDERKISHEGRTIAIEKHLALGKGGPDTCLRIYFYDDEETGKFVIGHVGRHKTNTRT